jgi:uncharacterized protein YecT (DUF1311 family)
MRFTTKSAALSLFLVAPLLYTSPLDAQAGVHTPACGSASNTAAMRACEQTRFDRADHELQTVYARLLAQVAPPAKVKLRAAETAWLHYRKTEADFQAEAAKGGSLAPLLRITILADLTEARSADLNKSLHP